MNSVAAVVPRIGSEPSKTRLAGTVRHLKWAQALTGPPWLANTLDDIVARSRADGVVVVEHDLVVPVPSADVVGAAAAHGDDIVAPVSNDDIGGVRPGEVIGSFGANHRRRFSSERRLTDHIGFLAGRPWTEDKPEPKECTEDQEPSSHVEPMATPT